MTKRILIIAAHPDDEVLGCGGTIARYAKEGQDVFIAILGEGITSRYESRDQADKKALRELHEKSLSVGKYLGTKEVYSFDFPDNRFDTIPLLDIVKKIESLIEKIKPDTIFTHHIGDLNIDHSITFRAVLTATRPVPECPVKSLYTFEIPSSTEWAFAQMSHAFSPNFFVDIKDMLNDKVKAMALYDDEIRLFPHPRSIESIKNHAMNWGTVVGVSAAEAFEMIRMIK